MHELRAYASPMRLFRPSTIARPLVAVSAALLLAACASGSDSTTDGAAASTSPAAAATELAGSAWVLTTYADDSGAQAPASTDGTGTLAFADAGALTGSTGCNQFTGTYTQDGSALTIAPGATTMKACTGDLGTQETAVLAALPEVASFTQSAGALTLLDSSGMELLVYAPGPAGLAGTSWTATGINNGKEAVESNAQTEKVTAEFGADGNLTGSGGCNTYTATYETSDPDGLKIGPVASTKMACEDDANTVEQQYFAALENVATYSIDGTTLTLRDADGSTQVIYAQVK